MAKVGWLYELLILAAKVLGSLYGLWHGLRFGWRLFKGNKDNSK